jgi:hypothetical protein
MPFVPHPAEPCLGGREGTLLKAGHPIRRGVVAAILVGLAACATPSSSATPAATAARSDPAPATSGGTPPPSEPPSAPSTGSAVPSDGALPTNAPGTSAFAWSQVLEVTGNGLAVRGAPSADAPAAKVVRWDPAQSTWVTTDADVRLAAGERVRVVLGPIQADGTTWYRVSRMPPPGQAQVDEVRWDLGGSLTFADDGWIATSQGETAFVTAVPTPPVAMSPPLVSTTGGAGRFESDPFHAVAGVAVTVVLAGNPDVACHMVVTLEPIAEPLVDVTMAGSVVQARTLSRMDLPEGDYRIAVTVDGDTDGSCNWAIQVGQIVG